MADLQSVWVRVHNHLSEFNEYQKEKIKAALFCELGNYTITEKAQTTDVAIYDDDMRGYTMYFVAKKVEGLAERSLAYYKIIIDGFLSSVQKKLKQITTDDVRYYLAVRQTRDKISGATVDSTRRILNGFFSWLSEENYIEKNVVKPIKKIRTAKKKKKAFNETELAKIKDACNLRKNAVDRKRALAIIEFLLSTGCRVGEISSLKIDDVDMENRTAVVFGKGSKERTVYLSAVAKLRLCEYLEARGAVSEYVFCSIDKPYGPIGVSGFEGMIRSIGKSAGVTNCHPHRFRRTMATLALKKGMSLLDIQRLLGHENIETTKIYLDLDDTDLKHQHEKLM